MVRRHTFLSIEWKTSLLLRVITEYDFYLMIKRPIVIVCNALVLWIFNSGYKNTLWTEIQVIFAAYLYKCFCKQTNKSINQSLLSTHKFLLNFKPQFFGQFFNFYISHDWIQFNKRLSILSCFHSLECAVNDISRININISSRSISWIFVLMTEYYKMKIYRLTSSFHWD